jgi:hypothetical protein
MCDKKLEKIEDFLKQNGYLVKDKGVTSTWQSIWVNSLSDINVKTGSPMEQWNKLITLECYLPPEYKKYQNNCGEEL